MGAVILPLLGLYLLLLVWATRRGWHWAQDRGWQGRKRWLGAVYGFLIVYLPVFWDWIPTVATHQYYCATEAGFWVYKTPEQWKKENPGVMETLVASDPAPSTSQGDMVNYTDTYFWNQRFNSVIRKTGPFLSHIWKHEQEIVDVKTGEVVGKRVDFSTGNGQVGGEPEPRFWLHSDHCVGGRDKAINFVRIVNQFKGEKK